MTTSPTTHRIATYHEGRRAQLQPWWVPAFRMVYELLPSKQVAASVVFDTLDSIDKVAGVQDDRRSHEPIRARSKSILPLHIMFQRALFKKVELHERLREENAAAARINLSFECVSGTLIKHKMGIGLRNPYYAATVIGRVLLNMPTERLRVIYQQIASGCTGATDDSGASCRRVKGVIMTDIKARFDNPLKVKEMDGAEHRFLDFKNPHMDYPPDWPTDRPCLTPAHIEIITKWMRVLMPWPAQDSKQNSDLNVMRQFLNPDMLQEHLKATGLSFDELLTFALLYLQRGPEGDEDSLTGLEFRGWRDGAPDLTEDDIQEFLEKVKKVRVRPAAAASRLAALHLLVDGRDYGAIEPGVPLSLSLPVGVDLVEIVSREAEGDVVVATHLLTYDDSLDGDDPAPEQAYCDEQGNEFIFADRILENCAGDLKIALEVQYHLAPWVAVPSPECNETAEGPGISSAPEIQRQCASTNGYAVSEVFSEVKRERLILEYLPQVRLIARRIQERMPESVSLDDLIWTGVVGLISAIDNFDPSHNVELKTYAECWIRQAILDSLRGLEWAPRQERRKAKQIEAAVAAGEQQLQRAPTEEEVAAELEISVDEYHEWLVEIRRLDVASLAYLSAAGFHFGHQTERLNSARIDFIYLQECLRILREAARILREIDARGENMHSVDAEGHTPSQRDCSLAWHGWPKVYGLNFSDYPGTGKTATSTMRTIIPVTDDRDGAVGHIEYEAKGGAFLVDDATPEPFADLLLMAPEGASNQLPAWIGKYELQEFLGGWQSCVYRARDGQIDRAVILKILKKEANYDEEIRRRFLEEARIVGRLHDDHIIGLSEFGHLMRAGQILPYGGAEEAVRRRVIEAGLIDQQEPMPYMVLEFCDGVGPRRAISEGWGYSIKNLEIALAVTRALEYVHAKKVLHRDLKPENIYLGKFGVTKLIDFGIARKDLDLTRTGYILGTPYYMSPEQVMGPGSAERPLTPASDVFSLGLVLLELFSGEKAFTGDTVERIFYRILNELIDFTPLDRAGVAAEVKNFIESCTKKKPEDRPQSYSELISVLQTAIRNLEAPRSDESTARPVRSTRSTLYLAGVVWRLVSRTRGLGPGPNTFMAGRIAVIEESELLSFMPLDHCKIKDNRRTSEWSWHKMIRTKRPPQTNEEEIANSLERLFHLIQQEKHLGADRWKSRFLKDARNWPAAHIQKLGYRIAPVWLVIATESRTEVINLLMWTDQMAFHGVVHEYRCRLIEVLSERDDDMFCRFMSQQNIGPEDLRSSLARAIHRCDVFPVTVFLAREDNRSSTRH